MSLKAGRVGVNPADVDPIDGHINPSSMEGYTKQEADAKFQPMTLEVPIKYLNGSALGTFNTVQEAFSGSYGPDGAKTNLQLTQDVAQNDITVELETGFSKWTENVVCKQGRVCFMNLTVSGTFTQNTEVLVGTIPAGYRPRQILFFALNTTDGYGYVKIGQDGTIKANCKSATASNVGISGSWLVS